MKYLFLNFFLKCCCGVYLPYHNIKWKMNLLKVKLIKTASAVYYTFIKLKKKAVSILVFTYSYSWNWNIMAYSLLSVCVSLIMLVSYVNPHASPPGLGATSHTGFGKAWGQCDCGLKTLRSPFIPCISLAWAAPPSSRLQPCQSRQ